MSKFTELANKIAARGKGGKKYSKDVARKIAAKIGDKKYGKEGMAKKAAASRKRHEK